MTSSAMERLRSPEMKKLLQGDQPVPLYFQLFTILRDYVLGGEIPVGTLLPSELELTRSFGVSRMTAKRALDQLAEAGMVKRSRGRGTVVVHRGTPGQKRPKPLRAPLTGLLEGLEALAEETDVKLLQFSRVQPPERVRALFGLDDSQPVMLAVRVRSRDRIPFGYYTSWTNTSHPQFNATNHAITSRLELFKRCDIQVARVEQTLSAVSADAVVAGYLKVKPGAALLTLERQSFDAAGRVVDLLYIQYRPDQFRYQMSLDVAELKTRG